MPSGVSIENNQCHVNESIWGAPCVNHTTSLDLTVNDVRAQKILVIADDDNPLAAAFFVPHCQFPSAKESTQRNFVYFIKIL